MRWYRWANSVLAIVFCCGTSAAVADCVPSSTSGFFRPEIVQAVCRAERMMPFKIKTRYIGEGGYHAFASAERKGSRGIVHYDVGIITTKGTPVPSLAQAQKMMGHFERRKKCPASDLRHSTKGPTLFTVTCSQADKR